MTKDCVACDSEKAKKDAKSASKEVMPIVIGIVATMALGFTIAVNREGRLNDWWMANEERIHTVSQHGTILVVTSQIVVNLQTVIVLRGGAPFPEPFASVVRWTEVFNLDAFAVFRVGCVANGFNYTTKLYTATLVSFFIVAAVFLWRMVKVIYGGRLWDGIEMKFMWLLIFFTLPTVNNSVRWGATPRAFTCSVYL